MKIIDKIKWNIDTWEVLEEISRKYSGPAAWCGRADSGGPAGADDAGTDQSAEAGGEDPDDFAREQLAAAVETAPTTQPKETVNAPGLLGQYSKGWRDPKEGELVGISEDISGPGTGVRAQTMAEIENSPYGIYNKPREWSEVYAEWEEHGWKGIYSAAEMRKIENKKNIPERTLDPVMAYYAKVGSVAMRDWSETKPNNILGKIGLTNGQIVGIRAAAVLAGLPFSPVTTAFSAAQMVYSQEKNIRNVLGKANIPESMIPAVSEALQDEWDKGMRGNVDQTGQGGPGILSTGAGQNVGGVPEYVIAHQGAAAASISYMNRTPGSWDAFRAAKKSNGSLTLDQWVAANKAT